MKVKLCTRCPYTPQDLAGHYDREAALHACAKCDVGPVVRAGCYPRELNRRRKSSTAGNVFGAAQREAAPALTDGLVRSGTTSFERPSIHRDATIA